MLLGESALFTLCVCVGGGPLCAMAPHMSSMLLGTVLPDVPTHLGVFWSSVTWQALRPHSSCAALAFDRGGSGLEMADIRVFLAKK